VAITSHPGSIGLEFVDLVEQVVDRIIGARNQQG